MYEHCLYICISRCTVFVLKLNYKCLYLLLMCIVMTAGVSYFDLTLIGIY